MSCGLLSRLLGLKGHQAYAAIGSSRQAGQGAAHRVLVVPDLHLVVAVWSRDDGRAPLEPDVLTPLMTDLTLEADAHPVASLHPSHSRADMRGCD